MGRDKETPEYAGFVRRSLRAYGRRVAIADEVDLAEMVKLFNEFEVIVASAIAGQLASGRSWTYVAAGLGMTRQGARQRWGKLIPTTQ